MQLTLTRILEINAAAKMLLSKPIKSSNLSWRIGRIHRMTETERLDFIKERNRLICEVHGEKQEGTEDDFKVKPENESAYLTDVNGLMEEVVELDLPFLKLEMFAEMELEPKFFDLMDNLITE
jgi:hypothetical protein